MLLLGSGACDLASRAEAISFLCLGRIFAHLHISVLPRPSVIKVCFDMLLNIFEILCVITVNTRITLFYLLWDLSF